MNQDRHLRFCLICKNRGWNLQTGVICGLTQNSPEFGEECSEYINDRAEFEKICSEKIKAYGLAEKEKGFFKEFISDTNVKSRPTQFIAFVKPRAIAELPSEVRITKSKIKYALFSMVPIVLFLIALLEFFTNGMEPMLIGFMAVCLTGFGWILFDFRNNGNSFSINRRGITYDGELISWGVILGTIIRETENERHLILLVPTKKDIEINLNGLRGPVERIENAIELNKKIYNLELNASMVP